MFVVALDLRIFANNVSDYNALVKYLSEVLRFYTHIYLMA